MKLFLFINFFTNLTSIVNIVCTSCSQFEELRIAQTAYLIEIDEIQSGMGLNQISNLERAGDTRWSSHLSF
jgi:hypothetical protein